MARSILYLFLWSTFVQLPLAGTLSADGGALEGYADDAVFQRQVEVLGKSPLVTVSRLARSRQGRAIYLLTVGSGTEKEINSRPAVLVVGNIQPSHVLGCELAVRMVRQISGTAGDDAEAARELNLALEEKSDPKEKDAADKAPAQKSLPLSELLQRYTLYVIPRPNPDATAACFSVSPRREKNGNARETDDDRDGSKGEDPPDDLNDDDVITMMRVENPNGRYIPHPDEPRIMIKADVKKGERGQYDLYVEGRDDDGDELFNEDAGDGVELNRNFAYGYPYFGRGAGPYQVSEPESVALADFMFEHPNIAAVVTFSPANNLVHTWSTSPLAEKGGEPKSITGGDAQLFKKFNEIYKKINKAPGAAAAVRGDGTFEQWAYYHYGRWSFSARGWWIPPSDAKAKEKTEQKTEDPEDKPEKETAKKEIKDKRAAEDINALRYFERSDTDAFVPWTAVEHPDFPDKKVEVGGFKPFYRLNPPAEKLNSLASTHGRFLKSLLDRMPRVIIEKPQVKPLGGGIYRVTVSIVNNGELPTSSEMGRKSRHLHPVQLQLRLPEDVLPLNNPPRVLLAKPLPGNGGRHEQSWLVRRTDDLKGEKEIEVTAGSPTTGQSFSKIQLPPAAESDKME